MTPRVLIVILLCTINFFWSTTAQTQPLNVLDGCNEVKAHLVGLVHGHPCPQPSDHTTAQLFVADKSPAVPNYTRGPFVTFTRPLKRASKYILLLKNSLFPLDRRRTRVNRERLPRKMVRSAPLSSAVESVPVPLSRPALTEHDTRIISPPTLSEPPPSNLLFTNLAVVSVIFLPSVILIIAFHKWRTSVNTVKHFQQAKKQIRNSISRYNSYSKSLPLFLGSVLSTTERALDISYASLAVVDSQKWEPLQIYNSSGRQAHTEPLIGDALLRLANNSKKRGDVIIWWSANKKTNAIDLDVQREETETQRLASLTWLSGANPVLLVAEYHGKTDTKNTAHLQTLSYVTQLIGKMAQGGTDANQTIKPNENDLERARWVSHEFKNILATISGYAEMASQSLQPGTKAFIYVSNIKKSGMRAKSVIDKTLLSTSSRKLNFHKINVVTAVRQVVPDLRASLSKDVKLKTFLSDQPIFINGDITVVQQIVTNLCKNAGEAITEHGEIVVKIANIEVMERKKLSHGDLHKGVFALVSVRDNGSGISLEHMSGIFSPRFTTKALSGGTGLGLSIAYEAIQELKGVIDIESKVGVGTNVDIYLPVLPS